jgi:DNA mismatch endonuclease (patch repair protein)
VAGRKPPARAGWEGVPEIRRRIMRSNRRRDTAPERAVRSALHLAGLRFRVDLPIRLAVGRTVRPDVIFPKKRVAIFIDGCFWHGCPVHGTLPVANREYWGPKIDENRQRDLRNTRDLEAECWTVIRAWEHEDPDALVQRVVKAIRITGSHSA